MYREVSAVVETVHYCLRHETVVLEYMEDVFRFASCAESEVAVKTDVLVGPVLI